MATTKGMAWDSRRRELAVEASGLGLPPGEWPEVLRIESHWTGAVREFKRMAAVAAEDGERGLVCVDYKAGDCYLRVFNG